MADGLETLNAELIRRILVERELNLYQLQKHGGVETHEGGGVSKNVWRKVLTGKPVRQSSRKAIGSYLKVEPSSLLLLDRKATLKMEGGKWVVSPPRSEEVDRTQPEKKVQPPRRTDFRSRAEFRELHALGRRVGKLTNPCYYGNGKSENVALTTDGAKAELIIDNLTMYDDARCSKKRFSGRLRGRGSFVDGYVNILYTVVVVDQEEQPQWSGVCVLWFPATGKIHGYWMSAGHKEQGRIVLGTLELERTLT